MFGKNKKPLLVDLDRGIIGTFVQHSSKSSTEPGFVYIEYVPFNSLKKVRYTQAVKTEFITTWRPTFEAPGVEDEIMFVSEGRTTGVMSVIIEKFTKQIAELQNKVEDLTIALATANQEVMDAHSGASKNIKRVRELNKNTTDETTGNLFRNPELLNEF